MIWKEKRMVTSANTLRLHLGVEPTEKIQNINFEGMSQEEKEKLIQSTFKAMKANFIREVVELAPPVKPMTSTAIEERAETHAPTEGPTHEEATLVEETVEDEPEEVGPPIESSPEETTAVTSTSKEGEETPIVGGPGEEKKTTPEVTNT